MQVIPSTIRPLGWPLPAEGLCVEGGTITVHIGDGVGVTIGLTTDDAYRVGKALIEFAVYGCKLDWTPVSGQA